MDDSFNVVSSGVLFSESSKNDTIKVDGQCQEQNKHQRKQPSIAKKPVAKKRMKRTVHKIMKKDEWKWEDIEDNYQPRACSEATSSWLKIHVTHLV